MAGLPAISGKTLVRALERGGFVIKRQSGSHILLEHTDGRMAVVPIHSNKDLPVGTLKGIIKDIEMSLEDLRALL